MRAIAAFAAGLALAGPALAQPAAAPQSVCSGNAEGAHGERVSVTIQLTQQGETVMKNAAWEPPLAAGSSKSTPEDPYPGLTINFPAPREAGLGQPDGALVLVMAFVPPGSRNHANPAKQLDGLSVEANSDGGPAQVLTLAAHPSITDLPMTAARFADLPAPAAGAKLVTLRLVDNKHRQRALARYDLSQTASRDALYASAWADAEKASLHRQSCELTGLE